MLYLGIGISAGSLILSILGFATLWFGVIASMKEAIARLVTKEEVTWAVISPHLANIIHQPTHYRRDFLMAELEAKRLNDKSQELLELDEWLRIMIIEAIENEDQMKQMVGALARAHVARLLLDLQPRKRTWLMRLFP